MSKHDALAMPCFLCLHITMQHESRGCGFAQLEGIPKDFVPRGLAKEAAPGHKPLQFSEYCECPNTFDALLQVAQGFNNLRNMFAVQTLQAI